MARTVNIIGGLGRLTETAEQLIRACIDWLKSHPSGSGSGQPASIGFILSHSVPNQFGPGIAESASPADKPELIYTWGNLAASGNGLAGWGHFQSSINNFSTSDWLYVRLDLPNALSISGSSRPDLNAKTPVALHHDVLVGVEPTPIESTFPGAVVTLMLWGIPPSHVN